MLKETMTGKGKMYKAGIEAPTYYALHH